MLHNCNITYFIRPILGSHPHNDPDLMGAWAYLVNGFKWWIIFPQGRKFERFLLNIIL